VNAREDTVHLENEAFTVEDREGRQWEEEGSRRGRRICCGDAAGVSAAARSKSRVEEIQGQD
jgi:hypothetical protein